MKKLVFLIAMGISCPILQAQTYLVPLSGSNTIATCTGTVYDHAGTGIYSNGVNGTLVINPTTAGSYVSLSFTTFVLESCCDYLRIYDGTSTAAPLLGTWGGTTSPGNVYATNVSGALTVQFTTDGSVTYDGFAATISCVTSIPLADLIIQTPTVTTSSLVAGGSSNISYTVKNQGGTIAAANSTGFYLSVNSTWDAGDTYLSSQAVIALSSGQQYFQNSTITIPVSTPLGNYYVLFYADYNGIINEDIETNNVNSFPISVNAATVDLYITNPSLSPTSVNAGGVTTAGGYVYNQGNSNAPASAVGYYLSTDLVFDVSDVFLSSLTTGIITPGNYFYASKALTIPLGTSAGNYYVLYFADYLGGVSESNEPNNVNASMLTVLAPDRDLTMVVASASPSTIAYGLTTSFSFSELNQGNQTESPSIGFYLSADSIFDLSDTYLAFISTSVAAHAFYNNTITLTIPSSTVPGNYFILSYTDYTNSIPEINETNNVYATRVTIIAPIIDLLIQTPTLSASSVASGSTVTSTCYINNVGNSSSPFSNIGFYLSTDAIFDAGDTYLNFSSGGVLAAGGSSYRSSVLTIPAGTTPGSYYVLYFADYTSQVVESIESNNVNSLPITIVAPVIDLTITSQSNPASGAAGANILALCNISNSGTTSSTFSNVGYYLSVDAIFDAGDTYLGFYSGGVLAAGATATRNLTLTIPAGTANGNYYILYFADYTNQVIELNETNNVSSFPIMIAAPFVDLVITSPSNPIGAVAGTSIAVTCNIYNNGNSTATSSNVGYYLSVDSLFDAGDTYLQSYAGGTLTAGTASARNTSLTIPLATATGNYFILYYADYSSMTVESNESNNVSGVAIAIGPGSGTTYFVPFTGTNSVTACSGVVYDHAGTSNYSNGANGTLTINPGTPGSFVALSFTSFVLESCCDYLRIYDGTSTAAPLIGTWGGTSSPGNIYATGASGALTLYFTTDGSVTYSGFSANISCVTSVPQSDLVIQSGNTVTPSTTISQGATANVQCYIANQGGSNASSSNIGYYLSVDTVWDASDTYLNNLAGAALGAGLSSYRASTITIPAGTVPGNYYVLFYADYTNLISETIETNNVRRTAVTITAANVDLVINSQALSASSVPAGTAVVASCYIFNQGNSVASSSNVAYYLSVDTVWDASDVYLNYTAGGTLAASGSSLRNSSVTIPLATTPGNYYVIYFADYTNLVVESIETNNKKYLPISVNASFVDLRMINYYLSSTTVARGSSVNAYSYVFNQGNISSSTSNVGFYLSIDSLWSASDVYLNSFSGGVIAAAAYSNRAVSTTIPAGTTPGNYYILYYADYTNLSAESNESNNVSATPITITNQEIDLLTLAPYSLSATLLAGTSVSVGATIFNAGNTASGSSNIGFYLSLDSLFDASDTYLSSLAGSSLAGGINAARNSTITIPSATAPGDYYILFYSDYSGVVTESDETNNVNFYGISVTPSLVDLYVLSPTLGATSVLAGSSVMGYSYIYNQGNSPVTYSYTGYYLSTDTVWSASDVFITSYTGGALAANTSNYRSSSLLIPAITPNGNYYILFYADYSSLVLETIETNNVSYVPLIVGNPFVDLTITSATATPLSMVAGSVVSLSCNINNIGTASSASSNVGYYLSVDSVWDASDVYLNNSSGSTLAAGSFANKISNVTIPVATTPGNYYILYYADYLNGVVESIETNNVAFEPISVIVSASDLIIQNPMLSRMTVPAGDTVVASCDIYNQGNIDAMISSVGFYLSPNMVYNASDVFLGFQSGGTLATATADARSKILTIPTSTVPGSYYILYFADYINGEDESNELNNVNYLPINIGFALSLNSVSATKPVINLFPNPTSDNVNLVIENLNEDGAIHVELMDITGKFIMTQDFEKTSTNRLEKTIDLEAISSGVYFIKIFAGETISVEKIVIN